MAEPVSKEPEVDETISERAQIEGYLKQFCLEEALDEAINEVVDKRPSNPYMMIGRFMETKTFPEILDLTLSVCIVGRGLTGVQASLVTNLSSFTAIYPLQQYDPNGAFSDNDMLIDFAVLESKGKEALKGQDPTKTEEIDEIISKIANITHPVAMALSIACCRAGARHSGSKPLYKFLADQIGTTAKMPVPVATVLTRAVGTSVCNTTQAFTVIPTTPSFFDSAMETIMHAAQAVNKAVAGSQAACTLSDQGCPTVLPSAMTAAACMQLVSKSLKDDGVEGNPRVGMDCRAAELLDAPPAPAGDDIPYVSCYTIVLPSFLVVSDAFLSIYCCVPACLPVCLHALTPHGTSLTIISLPQPLIDTLLLLIYILPYRYEDTEDKPISYIVEPAMEGAPDGGEDVPEKVLSGEEMVELCLGDWKATEYVTIFIHPFFLYLFSSSHA
jgi:hypothetical protein